MTKDDRKTNFDRWFDDAINEVRLPPPRRNWLDRLIAWAERLQSDVKPTGALAALLNGRQAPRPPTVRARLVTLKWRAYHTVRGWFACRHCGGSQIEEVDGGNGNVLELPCSYCQGTGRKTWRQWVEVIGVSVIEALTFVLTCATWIVREIHLIAWFVIVAIFAFTLVMVLM